MVSNVDEAVWGAPAPAATRCASSRQRSWADGSQQALDHLPPEYRELLLLVADS
jgi:hypothetical protein